MSNILSALEKAKLHFVIQSSLLVMIFSVLVGCVEHCTNLEKIDSSLIPEHIKSPYVTKKPASDTIFWDSGIYHRHSDGPYQISVIHLLMPKTNVDQSQY